MHIKLEKNEVAPTVLMPGDPARATRIAHYLEQTQEVNNNRGYLTYTGLYGNIPITTMSSGMGCPSAAIAVEELAEIGTKTIIRVGTCGGLQPDMRAGDLVIPVASMRSEGTTREIVTSEYPAVANRRVVDALITAAQNLGVRYHVGINRTHDAFYESMDNFLQLAKIDSLRLKSSEMECSAVFLISELKGIAAGAVLVVNTPEPPKEVAKDPSICYQLADTYAVDEGIANSIKVALEASRLLLS